MSRKDDFIVIGHRGSRGLKPENTIPAFLQAIKLGARGLEMDLYITRDQQVVVTHDATISAQLCLSPEGNPLDEEISRRLKIYSLNLKDIKPFDCGSEPNPDFPEQQNTEAHIPLLSEVVDAVERMGNIAEPIRYFMEFKSAPETDHINHPEPKEFVGKVVETIYRKKIEKHSLLMGFDKRCLREVRKIAPEIPIGLPVVDQKALENEIQDLGFIPQAIFPQFEEVNEQLMEFALLKNVQVFPWTVNQQEDMEKVLKYKISGLITDYPDKAIQLNNEKKL